MDPELNMDLPSGSASGGSKKKKSGGGGGFAIKGVLIGIPLFILHTIAIYFITANLLVNKQLEAVHKKEAELDKKLKAMQKTTQNAEGHAAESALLPFDSPEELEEDEGVKREFGKYLYNIDKLVINPAGTGGSKILLTSLAIDVPAVKYQQLLTEKKVIVQDAVISVLTSKPVQILDNPAYRDSIKIEIGKKIKSKVGGLRMNNIYFSEYIIQ